MRTLADRTWLRFLPVKLVFILWVFFAPLVVSYLAVGMLVPGDENPRPRVEQLAGGVNRYVFGSRQVRSMMATMGVLFVVCFATSTFVVQLPKNSPKSSAASDSRLGKYSTWAAQGFRTLLVAVLYTILVALLFGCIIWSPLYSVLAIETGPESLRFESLLRNWSVPNEQILHAEVKHEDRLKRRTWRTTVRLIVELEDGSHYHIHSSEFDSGAPEIVPYVEFLETARDDLLDRADR